MLGTLARSNPGWAPWILPLRALYVTFALLTWLAQPIFNLLLFLHPFGRHALDEKQRSQASWVGICLGLGAASLGVWLVSGERDYVLPALVFGLLALPVSAVFSCSVGWPRTTMVAITIGLALAGLPGVGVLLFLNPPKNSPMSSLAISCFTLFFCFFLERSFRNGWPTGWSSSGRGDEMA